MTSGDLRSLQQVHVDFERFSTCTCYWLPDEFIMYYVYCFERQVNIQCEGRILVISGNSVAINAFSVLLLKAYHQKVTYIYKYGSPTQPHHPLL